jgi:hypothetical protein
VALAFGGIENFAVASLIFLSRVGGEPPERTRTFAVRVSVPAQRPEPLPQESLIFVTPRAVTFAAPLVLGASRVCGRGRGARRGACRVAVA